MKFIYQRETEMTKFALKYSWNHTEQTEENIFMAGFGRLEPLCTSAAKFILTKTPLCQAIIFFHSEQFKLVKKGSKSRAKARPNSSVFSNFTLLCWLHFNCLWNSQNPLKFDGLFSINAMEQWLLHVSQGFHVKMNITYC